MRKLYGIVCSKSRKFEEPKISYLLEKKLFLSFICSKCENENEQIFTEKESTEISNILGLIKNIEEYAWRKHEWKIRLKKIDEMRKQEII